jgi:2-polyprenyl-3-methyl-5-hydroxy-6-metoxy-1,4-benzoquinol methylase
MNHRIRNKVFNFFSQPHFPYFLQNWIQRVSPRVARLIRYGRFNPNTQDYWDNRYSTGEYQRSEDDRYGDLREYVLQLVPPRSRVLDVGCGTATFMELLRDRNGCQCTGIDVSSVSVQMANQKGFPAFQCRLPRLPIELAAGQFDVCTVIETLEHVTDADETLQAVAVTVCDNGHIIVAVPDDCMKPEEFDEHVASYTKQSLVDLVGRHFRIDLSLSVESLGFRYLVVAARKAKAQTKPEST